MVAVSDNSATNVLIDRVGMDNVVRLTESLGLAHTQLRRKMMDLQAAAQGRENISTPREMISRLAYDLFDRLGRASDLGRVISPGNGSAH
jgi:beta-lactamase class A